jgi:hypothetical protein
MALPNPNGEFFVFHCREPTCMIGRLGEDTMKLTTTDAIRLEQSFTSQTPWALVGSE